MSTDNVKETWLKLDAMNGDVDEQFAPAGLAGFARQKAMDVLIGNWQHAMRDGASLADLLGDIDDLVADVQKFKTGIEERLADELTVSQSPKI